MFAIFVVGIQILELLYCGLPLKWINNKLIRNTKLSYGTSCLVVLNLLKRRYKYFVFFRKL